MFRLHTASLSATLLALFTTLAFAGQTVTFQYGLNGYTGVVDNHLSYGLPNTPNTDGPILWVDAITTSDNQGSHSLLRFDNIIGTGSGQIPANATVTSATLQLYTPTTDNAPGAGGQLHRMLKNWTDTDTWNSLVNGIQADGIESEVGYNAQVGTGASSNVYGYINVNVLTDVQAWVNGTSNFGWGLIPWVNGSNGWGFYSDSYTDLTLSEKLTVTFTAVPEPATPLLVVVGLSGLICRRTAKRRSNETTTRE